MSSQNRRGGGGGAGGGAGGSGGNASRGARSPRGGGTGTSSGGENADRPERGSGGRGEKRDKRPREREEDREELDERVIDIARVAKVIKGGRRFAFRTVVIVGDNKGRIGIGVGKSRGVPDSIRKGSERAKRTLRKIPLSGGTIPHEVTARYGGAKVLLKPASPGTGVIAGGGVRAVLEAVGVRDILTKSQGSNNLLNVAMATISALEQLLSPEDMAAMRGKDIEQMRPFWEQAAKRLGKKAEDM
ncbi:MAG: 30S ribosomal protein S5 [Armatimonadetes bacterium]|nr:30S ribosomal protein S5 [Anaerolineae bacterium]